MSDRSPTDVTRRNAIKTVAGGLAALSGIGIASSPAAARVSNPTMQCETGNIAISGRQSTKLGREYTYIFNVTNKSGKTRRIKAHGKGPRKAYSSRQIAGRSTVKFVLQSRRPLNRIVLR